MTLRKKTFSAVRWTTFAAVIRALLQIVQIAVLARLLEPGDYGLMAIVGVILGFSTLFADLGVNSAYVQRQEVTAVQRSSLFWMNTGMSLGISLLLAALSPLLARFFDDDRLVPLFILSAGTIVIGALGHQLQLTAEKNLNFRPVMLLEIGSALAGFVTAAWMAFSGFGVYALVGGSIVTTLSITLSAWIFLANGWRPRWQFSLEDVKPYLGFGTALVGNNLVNRVNLNIDLLLGGRLLGADLLGLYSVPRNLILQIQFVVNPIITRVGFPLIAQIQHDIARVRSVYLQTLNMTASTNAPLYMAIVFFAADIVQILLGRDWGGSVEFFRILAVWGFLRSTGNTVGSLLLGMGRADLSLKWNIGLLFVVPPALWVGSQFGTHGLAWTLLTLSAALYIPGWLILVRPLCHAGLLEYALASIKPMALAICAFALGHALAQQGGDALVRLLIGLPTSGLIYLALCYWWNRAWLRALQELIPLRRLRA